MSLGSLMIRLSPSDVSYGTDGSLDALDTNATKERYDYCANFWSLGATHVSDVVQLIRFVHMAFIVPPIVAMGILGNIASLVVLSGRRFRTRAYRYLFWLSVADTCTLASSVVYMLTTAEPAFRAFNYWAAFFSCYIALPLLNAFGAASAFMIVAVTADRFLAIWRPLESRVRSGTIGPGTAAGVAFGLAFGLYAPNPFQHSVLGVAVKGASHEEARLYVPPQCYRCTWSFFHRQPAVELYVFVREVVSRLVPVGVVFSLNVSLVVVYVRYLRRKGPSSDAPVPASAFTVTGTTTDDYSRGPRRLREQRRLVGVVLLVTSVFVVCMTPLAVSVVALSTVRKTTTDIGFELFRSTARVLVYVNYSCNFYLYLFCSPVIRKAFADICRAGWRRLTRITVRMSCCSCQKKNSHRSPHKMGHAAASQSRWRGWQQQQQQQQQQQRRWFLFSLTAAHQHEPETPPIGSGVTATQSTTMMT